MKNNTKRFLFFLSLFLITNCTTGWAGIAPTVSNPIPDTTLSEDFGKVFIRDLTGVFFDADTPTLAYSDSSFSGGMSTVISGDSLYLLSVSNFFGTVQVQVTAYDGESTVKDTFTVIIQAVNDPPVANNPIADFQLIKNFGTVFVSELFNNFTDVDNVLLSYTAVNITAGILTVVSSDSLYLSSVTDFTGIALVRVTAGDGIDTVADTFQVNVMETAPVVAQAIRDTSFLEDSGLLTVADLDLVFEDFDTPVLNYSLSISGNVFTAQINGSQLEIVTIPDSFGTGTVVVTAEDDLSQSAKDTVVITITPVNDAPRRISLIPDGSVIEDIGKKFIARLNNTFIEPDGETINFASTTSDLSRVTTLISSDSLYIITAKDSNGTVEVYVTATDPVLAAGRDTFSLTVSPVNDPPYITQAIRDTVFQQDFGWIFVYRLSDYFSDVEGDELTYLGDNLSGGITVVVSNDSLYFFSRTYFSGEAEIIVTASDSNYSVTDTFFVTVTNTNDAPVSWDWFPDIEISEDTSIIFMGHMSWEFYDPDEDVMTYSAHSSDTSKLSVTLSNDSLFIGPAHDSSGIVKVYVFAADPFNATTQDSFTIVINPVNDKPYRTAMLRDTTLAQNFGKAFIAKLTPIFKDIESPILSYTSFVLGSGVTVQISDDSLYLNSVTNYFGSVNVRIVATDGGGLSASDTFRVNVNDNQPPQAFVTALSSPVLNVVRFVCGANESLTSLTLSANGISVVMNKQGNLYFGDYGLAATGGLNVSVSASDLSGNVDTLQRSYQVSLLSKPISYGSYHFAGSSEGYLLVTHSADTEFPVHWKRYAGGVDIVMTGIGAELKIASAFERLNSVEEESKIGVYEYRDGQWVYVGGEGMSGIVKATLTKSGTYGVFYNPDHISVPREFLLSQNYPNPFNPTTKIRYEIPIESRVSIKVYNLLGQEVRTLVNEVKGSGRYEIEWNGKNDHGKEAASGVYLYRLQAGKFIQTRKMLFIK